MCLAQHDLFAPKERASCENLNRNHRLHGDIEIIQMVMKAVVVCDLIELIWRVLFIYNVEIETATL